MTRLLPLLLLALVFVPAAEAAKPPTCRSGETVYKRDGIRVFEQLRRDGEYWYACGPRSRRPTYLWAAEAGYGGLSVTGRGDELILFEAAFSGEGGGEHRWLGWFDARTSRARSGELAGAVENEVRDVVLSAGGALGVVSAYEDDYGVRVGYLAPSRKRGELTTERVLSMVGGRYANGSLAFADDDRALTWRLTSGETRSVPVAGEKVTCTSGTTVAESNGTRVFEVFPRRRTERGFQADVLAACSPGSAPRELAVSDVYDQDHWEPRVVKRAGTRVGFVVNEGGAGVIDGATGVVRFAPRVAGWLSDVALGPEGPLVVADGNGSIARLGDKGAAGLGRPVLLAKADGLMEGSLAVADGLVTWQAKDGTPGSTPLGGLPVVDCASGLTLLREDGLRVFTVLPAGAPDTRLYACPPGAAAPIELSGLSGANWTVSEILREGGRSVLWIDDGDRQQRVVSLGADARVGVPRRLPWYWDLEDVATAPDGRVAFAQRYGRKWRISVFGLAGAGALKRERLLAKPTDGVKAGSLAFDGTRVTWRNRKGARRGSN